MKTDTYPLLQKLDSNFNKPNNLMLFWAGILLYMLGYVLSFANNPIHILCDLLRVVGIVMFCYNLVILASFKFDNSYFKVLYFFYCFWSLIVVARGLQLNYVFIKDSLFSPFLGAFLYFTPLILLLKKPPLFYKLLYQIIACLGILYIILTFLSLNSLLDANNIKARDTFEVLVKTLAIPSGFILMTANYHKKTKKSIAFITLSIALLLSIYLARRGLMFICGCAFIFSYFLFILRKKKQLLTIIFGSFMVLALLFLGLIAFENIENSQFFEKATKRMNEDTRSGVEDYYYADMEFKDYIIGRGMSGLVAAPTAIDNNSDHPGYREGIETDYLNIILKGGVISLGLLLLIAVPAMINCFFFSKNTLSKAAGFWILLWIISLYPSTVTTFTLNYILVWLSIGIGYSFKTRNIPEKSLEKYFNNPSLLIKKLI